METPNLDCMEREALRRFARRCLLLAKYATYKAQAIEWREKREIVKALDAEARCDDIYRQIPKCARW